MNIRTRGRRGRSRVAVLAAALAAAHQVRGDIWYDLRLADGTRNAVVAASGVYTLSLWARVSGTNSTHADEGFQSSYLTLMSTQLDGGGVTSGGLSSAAVASDFQSNSGTVPLYQNGTGSDLNGDGITDWGSTSTAVGNPGYVWVRASGMILAGGSVGQQVDASTWEFKLATFTVKVDAVGTGTTFFSVVKPNATGLPQLTYALGRVDNTTFTVTSSNQHNAYAMSLGVAFQASGAAGGAPTTMTWDGGPTSTGATWSQPENWAPDPITGLEHVPGPQDRVILANVGTASTIGINMAGTTNNGPANQAVACIITQADRDIVIQNSSATAGTLTVNADVGGALLTNNSAASTLTIQKGPNANLDVALTSSGAIEVTNANATIVVNSAISGTGKAITKTGKGWLVLGGLNTFTGATRISTGGVEVTSTGVLASTAVSLNGNTELDVEGALNPTTALSNFGLLSFSSASQTLASLTGTAGSVELWGTALTIGSGSFTGPISGYGSLLKNTSGTLTLTGFCTYTGGTVVSDGTLAGTTAGLTGTIINNGAVVCTSQGDLSATMSGTGSFTKNGTFVTTLKAPASYTGATNLEIGTFAVSSSGFLAPLSTFNISSGAQLNVNGSNQTIGQLSGAGQVNLQPVGSILSTLSIGANNSSSSFSGTIASSGNLTKLGAGDLTLSADNTYTGKTSVVGGKLILSGTSASSAFLVNSGATLRLSGAAVNITSGSVTAQPGGAVEYTGAPLNLSGGTLINNGVFTGDIDASNTTLIKGSGTFNGSIVLHAGGRFSPGNSPGSVTAQSFTFGAGGKYIFEITDATGAPGFGTDLLNVVNSLTVSAGASPEAQFLVSIASLNASGSPAAPDHFNRLQEYHWKLVHTGSGILGFNVDSFAIDTSAFTPSLIGGTFDVSQSGNDLMLNFTPVPEATPAAAAGLLSVLAGLRQRRRNRFH
jgi:autotransporter-associated beta strand protein